MLHFIISSGSPRKESPLFTISSFSLRSSVQLFFVKVRICIVAAACIMALATDQAHAIKLDLPPEWGAEGFIDTTITASAAMRVENAAQVGGSGNQSVFPDAGDIYSTPLSLLTDVGFKKDNYGAFARLSYIYDYAVMDKDCSNCSRPTPATELNGVPGDAQDVAGNKFRLLDAFVYGSWDLLARPLEVRVGKQVVNWGESNILGGGISQMQNPADLAKSTVPGTEVKETLMPQESVYAQFGVTDTVSVEAYYVWNWRESVFIPVGTLFSPTDLLGNGYNPDLVPGVPFIGRDKPSRGGQWGVALHKVIESWNFADVGIYYVKSHAFTPFIDVNSSYNVPDPFSPGGITRGGYEWVFAEDQETYAISLNGIVPGTDMQFQTELNYKPDFFDTRQCSNVFGLTGGVPGCGIENSNIWTYLGSVTYTDSTTFLGADLLSLVADVNLEYADGLGGGDPTDPAGFDGVSAMDSPITDFSWGYATVASLTYNNFFANANMIPSLVWIHNVEGYQPGAAGGMVEDQQVINASVEFVRQDTISLQFRYSAWLGSNGGNYDRDNVAVIFKYSF